MTFPSTFAALWDHSVESNGVRPFLRFEASDGTVAEWTYAQFDEVVDRTASAFTHLGVGPARGVHLVLTNSPSFVAAWLAAVRLGSFVVPSDPMATAPELAEHLGRTVPAVSVVAAARRGVLDGALASLATTGCRPAVIEVDDDDVTCGGLTTAAPVDGPGPRWPTPAGADRAAVLFTSGTTGRPKGVVITQANYAFAGATMARAADLEADDRQLVVLPLFHANAQYYSFASAIAVGASVALMHRFTASGFLAQAARHGATHASLFAGPMRMILARGERWQPAEGEAPLRLRHCWYAQNLDLDQYETLADWLGCRPRQLYGMTETIAAVLTDRADQPRHDAMGFVTAGCSVAIHDADGGTVEAGIVGEVVVGGEPGTTLFGGYLDDPETTARSFRQGWFLTGDRASFDAEGRFFFDGRSSDVLKVSGENVSVAEVEAALRAHPGVFDVAVVGAPDPVLDEVPVAFVVPRPDAGHHLADDLTRWCEARLAKAKRPRTYNLVDELPRTSVGKVRTFMLRAQAAAASVLTTETPRPAAAPPPPPSPSTASSQEQPS